MDINLTWKYNDITNILKDIKIGKSIEEISILYNRNIDDINKKLINIALLLINVYDFDIEVISKKLNISIEIINEHLNIKNKELSFKETITNKKLNNNELSNNEQSNKELNNNEPLPKKEIILNNEQENAFNNFINKKNIFITGPAGTGKSVTLIKIIEYCEINNIKLGVTATTGNAAFLIGGKTIHSFLGIGIATKTAKELFEYARYNLSHTVKKIRELDVLIIDEISMLGIELFEKISEYMTLIKKNSKPFGGIQIILTGDFCQIESVNDEYCFLSKLWDKLNLEISFLYKMIRQDGDKKFQNILRNLRYGICTDKILKTLSKLKNTEFDNIKPTKLYPKNFDVNSINKIEYQKLLNSGVDIKKYEIQFPITKKYKDKTISWLNSLDIPLFVELCIGAEVVVTTNINQDKGIINGTRGIITNLYNDKITIKKIDGDIFNITFFKSMYYEDKNIYFNYMPLKLAYALSIHKSQGCTLDAIEIDIGKNIFAAGQAYTAISRARNLNSIKIKDISKDSFIIKDSVLEFYSKIDPKLNY